MIIDTTDRMTTGREEFDWSIWGILFSLYPQKFNLEFINKIHVNLITYYDYSTREVTFYTTVLILITLWLHIKSTVHLMCQLEYRQENLKTNRKWRIQNRFESRSYSCRSGMSFSRNRILIRLVACILWYALSFEDSVYHICHI